MDYEFDRTSKVTSSNRSSVEEKICATQGSGHSYVTFCHPGVVTVTLSSTGLFQDRVVGNLKCSCGKPKGMLTGALDGSHLVIEAL